MRWKRSIESLVAKNFVLVSAVDSSVAAVGSVIEVVVVGVASVGESERSEDVQGVPFSQRGVEGPRSYLRRPHLPPGVS
jgi:hypothetical protein